MLAGCNIFHFMVSQILAGGGALFVCLPVYLFSGPQADLKQTLLLLRSNAVVKDAVFVYEWSCQNAALKPGCTFQH